MGLAAREWGRWADGRTVVRCHSNRTDDLCAAWVTAALPTATTAAEAWLIGVTGRPLPPMTRFDFDTLWRTLPADTTRPAAVAAHAALVRRFTDTPVSAAGSAVRVFAELLPDPPSLLILREKPSADPNCSCRLTNSSTACPPPA